MIITMAFTLTIEQECNKVFEWMQWNVYMHDSCRKNTISLGMEKNSYTFLLPKNESQKHFLSQILSNFS